MALFSSFGHTVTEFRKVATGVSFKTKEKSQKYEDEKLLSFKG